MAVFEVAKVATPSFPVVRQPNDFRMIVCLHTHCCMKELQILILLFLGLTILIESGTPIFLHFAFRLTVVNAFAPKWAGLVERIISQAHVAVDSFLDTKKFCLGKDK